MSRKPRRFDSILAHALLFGVILIAMACIGYVAVNYDYDQTKQTADRLGGCVEYSFWKRGYVVIPCR